jgi:hypothetical protein
MIKAYAPISIGELIDKITILEIKTAKLTGDPLLNTQKELLLLERELASLNLEIADTYFNDLREVNNSLWHVEDKLRDHENNQQFDKSFIDLARSVYKLNDHRAAIKKNINLAHGSEIIEEKIHLAY